MSDPDLHIPETVARNARRTAEGAAWLRRLSGRIRELSSRWSLTLGEAFDGPEVSAAWVAPARRADGSPAVLKLGMPHTEADDEIPGLRFWDGDPTVQLLGADEDANAMLLERCEPGTHLRTLTEDEQDVIMADILRRAWRRPSDAHRFRPLSEMLGVWSSETIADEARWPDPGLVREGLSLFERLSRPEPETDVLLATDAHAGNVLRAQREPWLLIDPKPFIGDRTYDATQHLINCQERLRADPDGTIARFADLLELDAERVRSWLFARFAAESRDSWDDGWIELARILNA